MNSKIEELKQLLENDVLVELIESIEEVEDQVTTEEDKEELQYLKDLKRYFDETLKAIEEDKLSIQQAEDILAALENMKNEDDF
ncbi:hypothetical protein CRU99_01865 [Malaciobacter mytili]|uniref:Uncharacterized protein n=1 Tax=Malaciobacter mytili LMG 24559 TaxID=1032238 RepID=A0AAX2AIB8_9BACT|nr:hypothetical protein [Malaciobacter mytili]AXH14873.1 hypothetical protein AMYT_1290 [Malaciobacter mytili LMG 24559]RXI48029.1 hypothetical protein CRU99_01865 [Malaciobacter mytili]RXK16757.1 hypothetical protein CP985_00970 [Malaciobacter mytili LMG 24559]